MPKGGRERQYRRHADSDSPDSSRSPSPKAAAASHRKTSDHSNRRRSRSRGRERYLLQSNIIIIIICLSRLWFDLPLIKWLHDFTYCLLPPPLGGEREHTTAGLDRGREGIGIDPGQGIRGTEGIVTALDRGTGGEGTVRGGTMIEEDQGVDPGEF